MRTIDFENEVHIELALMALASSPSPEDASAYLQEEEHLLSTPKKLAIVAKSFPEQYEALRHRIAPIKEKALAHNLLDNALYASEVTYQALEVCRQRLAEDRVREPWKVARDLADVQAKAVDKKLALEGRPTAITETRDVADIVRALESKGVMKTIEATSVEI